MKFVRIFDPKSNLNFVGWFKISWAVTGILLVATIIGLLTLGMPWGIDFLGGTEMQVKFQKPVSANDIRNVLATLGFDKNQVQQFGATSNNEMLIRVESVAALKDTDVTNIKSLIDQSFPKKATEGNEQTIL